MQPRYAPPYSSHLTFLGAAREQERDPGHAARFAVAGVAYDGAVTNRPGARFGPAAVRLETRMLCDAIHPLYHYSPRDPLVDLGDLPAPVTSIERHRAALQAAAETVLGSYHVCWLGGDH